MNRPEAGAVIALLARAYPSVIVTAIADDWATGLEDVPFVMGMTAARMLVRAQPTFVNGHRTVITLPVLLGFVDYLRQPVASIGTYSPSPPPGMIRVLEDPRPGKEPDDEPASGA